MGLFDRVFGRKPSAAAVAGEYFKMLNGYLPVFTNAPESVYEMEVTRSAIHAFASACSKLKLEGTGSVGKTLTKQLQFRPNPFMDASKFLYRLATVLEVETTAFVVPMEDAAGELVGYYPILPSRCEVVELRGVLHLRYTFNDGNRAAVEFDRVGILTKFQHADDFFGEGNRPLRPTMQLINSQNQGIINAVRNSAAIRFLARIGNMLSDDDLAKERKRFSAENLSADNDTGVMMFDSKYADVRQIESKPFTVNAVQMKQIEESVYRFFGTPAAIITNSYDEDGWNAWYEGKVEPFAIQLSLVLSNMTFTAREIAHGNAILATANRLQYASNNTKLQISTQLFDRGLITPNRIMDIWNEPPITDGSGDKRYMRRDYATVNEIAKGDDSYAGSAGT